MIKPIYANKEHEVVMSAYIIMVKEFVKDVSNKDRWNNYLNVLDIIIEYHNNYGKGVREQNYWDWLMILPIQITTMTNGYLAGIETKGNATLVKSYRLLVSELVQDVVTKIEKLEPVNE
tara:strand:+ start:991 stop:1347 length:357 start_codon:yes stop_codon:yes gene_type:complete